VTLDATKAVRNKSSATRLAPAGSDVRRLIFLGVSQDLGFHLANSLTRLHHIEFIAASDQYLDGLKASINSIDAVLLGTKLDDPLAVAQSIHLLDKRLPIIILNSETTCSRMRQDLMFSPFVGHEVLVWPTTDIDGLAPVLADAAERRQQRLRFQEATIANAHVQLEVLPLLQPGAAEYVEGLFDHAPIGVLATDQNGVVRTLNRQSKNIFGVAEEKAIGRPLHELFPKPEHKRIKSLLKEAINADGRLSHELFEFPLDGEKSSFFEVTITPFSAKNGKRGGTMVVVQEVTLRVQVERQRTEAVVELQLIANVLRAFHSISTDSSRSLHEKIRQVLKLGCEQFGLPIGVISRVSGNEFVVLESITDIPKFFVGRRLDLDRTYCATTIDSPEPISFSHAGKSEWRSHSIYKEWQIEAYIGAKIVINGSTFGTLCFMGLTPRTKPFASAERETLKLMSQWIASELQRELAEAHMRKLSSAIEQTADTVVITNFSGIVEYVNPSFEALTGYGRNEVVGHPAKFLNTDGRLRTDLWEAIGHGTNLQFLHSDRTKSGKMFHEQMTISPLKDTANNITHFIVTGRDVTPLIEAKETDRKRQSELTHVARLSTLGGMISGLAHELNQPLCAIMTYAQTCVRKLESTKPTLSELKHGLKQIVRQAERADQIFVRMRNFSRKREMRRQRANVREIVNSALGFVQTELHHNNIKLKLSIPKNTQPVFVDAIQIQQVLINLLRNSIDALSNVDEAQRTISIKVSSERTHLTKIAVTDNGCGFNSGEVDRVFEPFFTTKEAGLGVGLSISQGIVEAHDGKLWLHSTSSSGTTFNMTIPNWKRAA
jgi:PAS domain S-box-containing protein